jgi:hypothetical protein
MPLIGFIFKPISFAYAYKKIAIYSHFCLLQEYPDEYGYTQLKEHWQNAFAVQHAPFISSNLGRETAD